jgi:hypothetical protein
VRDAPYDAVIALEELGYDITPPKAQAKDKHAKLRAL